MESITAQLDKIFRHAIQEAFGLDADPLIQPSGNEKFGDYQANAAMGLVKAVSEKTGGKANPRQIAEQIVGKLALGEMAEKPTIAGPGFINVKLSPAWLDQQLDALRKDERLGIDKAAAPQTVVVDYSGPNIAKELHVGHLRSTIIGDAVARILDFAGHTVIRQNHVGDWGTQFGMLIAYQLAHVTAPHDNPDRVPPEQPGASFLWNLEAAYRAAKAWFDADEANREKSREVVVKLQSGDSQVSRMWTQIVQATREHYESIYQRLGVLLTTDDERGESFYNPLLKPVVDSLKLKGLATASDGATVVFTEGYENPLIIEKSGGGYLYATTDLAAVRYRIEQLKAQRVLYFVDARQGQHFAQVFAVARRAGWAEGVSLEHAAFGTMLGEDGKPFKTRSGGVVKLKELLDEAEERAFALVTEKNAELPEAQRKAIAHGVGIGGVKYSDLSKDRTSDYVFAFDKMLAMDGNTAPYLQYAYARIRSIFRRAAERGIKLDDGASFDLAAPQEIALAKHVLRMGQVIEAVVRELKPHHLCNYLYELATKFSSFFENCPVIQSEERTRGSRLALCDLTARTMALGLELLGIEHPEQM